MNSRLLKLVSLFLSIVLLVNLLPLNVLADEISSDESSTITSGSQIVEEVVAKRTEYTKEYLLDNGLFVAAVYNEPVHFEKDGQWEEIDNTLVAKADGTYTNTDGVWDVQFPQQLSQSNAISITKDGYSLSFGMAGELRNQGNWEIASEEGPLSASSTTLETASVTIDGTAQTFAVSSAQTSSAQIQEIDTSDAKEAAQYQEFVLDKNTSRLTYGNVYTNTDIQYDLQANSVKESIVLESYDSNLRGYRYTLNAGDLIPVQEDDGSILFFDKEKKNVVMAMPAPFLMDKNLATSYDVQVGLTGSNGVYTLVYLLPQEWLSATDRAWPVILDPVVVADLSDNNIQDTTVISARPSEADYMRGMLQIGYSANDGISRVYLGFSDLPVLSSSDVIVNATMALNKEANSDNAIPAVVHKVNSTWSVETLCWNNMPNYDPTIEDYAIVQACGRYYWDITDIARDWYANTNTGMLIKASDAVENSGDTNSWKEFYSCNYADDCTDPWLYITYRNNNGLESYWDYTASSAGRAGTGYVNSYTGNMVWTRSDIGFGGNRMPVSINHIYNLNDAADNSFGMGFGWRTNFNQRVYNWSDDSTYYIWEDSDGTEHYFYYVSSGTYKDEDGLELTLKTNGSGTKKYSITDKYGNASYFDTSGRLTFIENNQATKSSIAVTYTTTSGLLIDKITDGAGRVYDFTYPSNLLSKIDYLGSGSSPISSVSYTYSSSNLTKITDADGKSSNYTYSGNILVTAQDVDGYKLQYSYYEPSATFQPYRVKQIKEFSGSTAGGELNLEYAHNQTTFTDHNGNVEIMQFNNLGNTVSIQDGEGRAQHAQYATNNPSDTIKSNQLRISSKLQDTVNNLFADSSFEGSYLWTVLSGSGSQSITNAQAYFGSRSLALTNTIEVQGGSATVAAGQSYSFSAYVKTAGPTVTLKLSDGTTTTASQATSSPSGWTRVEVSYTNTGTSAVTVSPRVLSSGTGTAYIDCVQAESQPTPSRYNLVQNSNFAYIGNWSSSVGRVTPSDLTPAAPQLNSTVYQLTGTMTSTNRVTQGISVRGAAGDTFVLAGWAKGDSVPTPDAEENTNQRRFAVVGTFHYTDGTFESFYADFNPDTDSSVNWQYSAQVMIAAKSYSTITVALAYDYNANTVYFDGIQLFKEEFGNTYTYDNNGNVTSVKDLQAETTTYEYNTNNDITKILQGNQSKMTYTYDAYHNVETATTAAGVVYRFAYDTYGNNTSVTIQKNNTSITSSATYSANGNQLVSTTDALGGVTTYGYNANTNVLEWVKYPGDTDTTRTDYSYDAMYRLATAEAGIDANTDLSASYTYTNDNLTAIQTGSTTYSFTYGNFSLRSSVKAGNYTLANYTYTADRNNYLNTLAYGNGDSVQYTYDDHGRVTKATYSNGQVLQYFYDSSGRLATTRESGSIQNVTYRYLYDSVGRLGYTEKIKATTSSLRIWNSYNSSNLLESQRVEMKGDSYTKEYAYNTDNTLASMVTGTGQTIALGYDDVRRVNSISTPIYGITYGYRDGTSLVSSKTYSGLSSNQTFGYTYDNRGYITGYTDSGTETTYSYDSKGQLKTATVGSQTYSYTYDDAGNILTANGHTYTYGNNGWGDLLTAYDGQSITYDGIGNPLSYYNGTRYTFTWENGRMLKSVTTTDGLEVTFLEDIDGCRTRKTVNGVAHNYLHQDGKVVKEKFYQNDLLFYYDQNDAPYAMRLNGTLYYYITNMQGDVVAMVDGSGNTVATYQYDPYGKILSSTGSNVTLIVSATQTTTGKLDEINPLRYRGYYYDQETGLYYLQSRYYDPEVGRFINADAFASTGQGLLGNSMFAYCLNNPINIIDPSGTCGYIYSIYFWSDCGKKTCEHSKAYVDVNNLGSNITYFTVELFDAAINSVEASAGTGIGFGGTVGTDVYGVPVSATAYNRSASMLSLSDGTVDIISVTSYAVGANITQYLGCLAETGVSHSIMNSDCHCIWWDSSYGYMATCKANRPFNNDAFSVGFSFGAYFIIGLECSLSFNIKNFSDNVVNAWNRAF